MKRICSFFSRLLALFTNLIIGPVSEIKIGFNFDDPFYGIEFDSIRKNNLQDHIDQHFD